MAMVFVNGSWEKADLAVAVGCHSPRYTQTQLRRLERIEKLLKAKRISFSEALELRR